jgi:tetratricopeptide (TPR) repeat protein
LRISFDNLAKVYHAQRKYTQAKWFILQSNTLSRDKKDSLNIIASLIELASIKSAINDYSLAMRDLNEALNISSKNHYPQQESEVQLNYALLYNNMKNYVKAATALKRHQTIDDSIKRDEEAKLIAKQNTKDSLQQVKDSLQQVKKKALYLKQQEALREQLSQKTSVVIILILIITLITIGIFFLYRRKRTGFWRSGIKRKH